MDSDAASAAIIDSLGVTCSVSRRVQTGTNKYNKAEYDWQSVGRETVVRTYPNLGAIPEQLNLSVGEHQEDRPYLAFALGADIQKDDRVTYPDAGGVELVYEIEHPTRQRGYVMASADPE